MEKENTKTFDFVVVKYDKAYYNFIEEIYRLHKDQKRKIFDLACGIETDDDIIDYIKSKFNKPNTFVFVALDGDKVAATIIMENICLFNDKIIRCEGHIVVCRRYWGKSSRDILNQFFKTMDREFDNSIGRYEVYVPANNFGIIKLIKDVGFKCEGTMKNRLVFENKHGKPTLYDELLFSRTNEGLEING